MQLYIRGRIPVFRFGGAFLSGSGTNPRARIGLVRMGVIQRGERPLDCAGTTGLVADRLGRNTILIEAAFYEGMRAVLCLAGEGHQRRKPVCSRRASTSRQSQLVSAPGYHLVEAQYRTVEADLTRPTETRLRGWACKIRTQKRRRKLSL